MVYDKSMNDGLTIHFSGGDYCDEKRDYDLTLNIICDKTVVKNVEDVRISETHKCFKHLTF